jgi:hypothetical protein
MAYNSWRGVHGEGTNHYSWTNEKSELDVVKDDLLKVKPLPNIIKLEHAVVRD